jgi:hypothetical protein
MSTEDECEEWLGKDLKRGDNGISEVHIPASDKGQ